MIKKQILIIEDHPLFRAGLIQLLKTDDRLEICGEADSRAETLNYLDSQNPPDLILLDLSLKDTNGLELLKDIHYRLPDIPVLVVSMHEEQYYAERVLNAGAMGYVMKQEAAENILEAVNKILDGSIYVSASIQDRLLSTLVQKNHPIDRIRTLSDREMEIFEWISKGLGTKKISEQLNISVKTIETHKEHIKNKLDIGSSAELRRFAIEWRNDI